LGNYAIKTTPILPNSPDKEGLTKVINLINSGNNILIFPEGTRSRTSSMAQGKKGILLIQKLTNAVIVPLGLYGTEELLSISSDDMAKEEFQHANVNVRIGKPIQLPKKNIDETKKDYEDRVLNLLMVGIASLLPKEYRGVYAHLVD
jgi:1-acyl-sn-glycerol-3-phosphate acyltransferase